MPFDTENTTDEEKRMIPGFVLGDCSYIFRCQCGCTKIHLIWNSLDAVFWKKCAECDLYEVLRISDLCHCQASKNWSFTDGTVVEITGAPIEDFVTEGVAIVKVDRRKGDRRA